MITTLKKILLKKTQNLKSEISDSRIIMKPKLSTLVQLQGNVNTRSAKEIGKENIAIHTTGPLKDRRRQKDSTKFAKQAA